MAKSSGLIINTCESLEPRALAAIRDGSCITDGPTPPLFPIGPAVDTKDGNFHVDRHKSLQWLDSQPSGSVVFLCFGSMGVFSIAQIKEMATGLERSGVRFLWVVRPPPPDTKTGAAISIDQSLTLDSVLPEGFLDRIGDRGLVVKSWAPQVDVLRHSSVGGFVSHCGWNSILEALNAEVPMVAWPLYAEQKLNRAFLVDEAKIAIRLIESDEGFVSAGELENRVNELMSSGKGKELRKNVAAIRDAMVAATASGGTSRKNLAKLAEIFKQN